MSSRYEHAREIFDHAELLDGTEREQYLAGACGEDHELRKRVETLLNARDSVGEFMESAAAAWRGQRIGRFEVEGVIAEGGMGVVLRATQRQPNRQVALKLIRGPGFSPAALQRFELEVEVLGRLDHPAIAQIYEAGTADRDGISAPYFAMELIDGTPLTDHAQHLGIVARLQLMSEVCDAVHHAHLRGVIHRDLKPSNILVRPDGQPKVLDFGVARVTGLDMNLTTMHTSVGQILGTLPYMSPEQVRGEGRELDLRSDVYALGVLTFEVLTGRLPQPLQDCDLVEAVRIISSEDPDTLGDDFPSDLQTVVAKCLRKDPADRYESAADFAQDLRRFLRNEPVAARPPSAIYHWRKFARRNRGVVGWAAFGILALVVGLGVSVAGWSSARTERNRAVASAAEANELSGFLVELLSSPDPRQEGGDVLVRDVLERASDRSGESFADQPGVAVRLHRSLGMSYRGLGLDEQALVELEAALDRTADLPEPDAREREVSSLLDLGNLHFEIGNDDTVDSLLMRIDTLSPREPENRARRAVLAGMHTLARGDQEEAIAIFRNGHLEAERTLGPDHRSTLDLYSEQGFTLWRAGRAEEARDVYEEVYELEMRMNGAEHPATLKAVNNLGMVYRQLGDYPKSRDMLQQAVDSKIRLLGPGHPSTALGHHNLALVMRETGEYEGAIAHHEIAIAVADSLFRESDPRRPHFHAGYAGTLFRLGRYDECRSEYLASYEALEARYGPEHERIQSIFEELAACSDALGDPEGAAEWRLRLVE